MLLAVQLVPHPEVPSHLQVQPTVSAGVAARMAVPPLLDTHGLVPLENASHSKEGEEEVTARVSKRRPLIQRQICRGFEMVGEKSKAVAFLPPPGRRGKKPRKRRDSREKPVQAS